VTRYLDIKISIGLRTATLLSGAKWAIICKETAQVIY